MDNDLVTIRRATRADEPVLGQLGAALMRLHYDFDRQRFLAPGPQAETGYGRFLASQIDGDDTAVFVAERQGRVVGYVYAGVEPLSWKELRERAGFIHDVLVQPGARGSGAGEKLIEAAAQWLGERGVPRILLWTATQNQDAQRLFARSGFRATMIEMTREVKSEG